MKRAVITGIVCAMLVAGVAWAAKTWQDDENMGGFSLTDPTEAGGGNQCAQFDNNGKLSSAGAPCGSGGGVSLPVGEVGFGTGTGITSAPNLYWDNGLSRLGIQAGTSPSQPLDVNGPIAFGTHVVGVQPSLRANELNAAISSPIFYPNGGGANVWTLAGISPKGTGASGVSADFFVFGTDFIADGVNFEFGGMRSLSGAGSTTIVGTGHSGTGTPRPLMLAADYLTNDITNDGQLLLNLDGTVSMISLAAGGMTKAAVTTGKLSIAAVGSDYAPAGSCGPHQFVQATNSASLLCAQPAFTDISGSLACSQTPAYTGAVVKSAGSCATTVNFSGLTGSASCAQLPALTGAVTSSAGSCATSYAGMPASTQVAVGAGATSAPTGSANLTFSAGNLSISNTAKLSGVTVSSMLSTDSGHFVQAAVIGTGLSFSSNTLAPAWAPKLTLPFYFTNGFLAFPAAGSWLLMGGFSTTSTSPIEWGVNAPVAPTNISLNVEVIVQTLVNSGGTCNVSFIATKNGSGVGGTNITESATGHYNVTVTGQTIAVTDTFGVFMSTSAFCNGASSSLTITANLGVY